MDPQAEALFDAIDDGDVDATLALLEQSRGLLSARDEGGMTPLLRAAVGLTRDPQLLRALLSAGADPTATTDDGETALHLLVDVEGDSGFGDEPLQLLQPLVDAGCPLEAPSADGLTPLALAVVHGTPDEVQAFVQLGASLSARLPADFEPADLASAPLLAAALGSPEKVEALVAAGADASEVDGAGASVVERCQRMLDAARADGQSDLTAALERCLAALERRAD